MMIIKIMHISQPNCVIAFTARLKQHFMLFKSFGTHFNPIPNRCARADCPLSCALRVNRMDVAEYLTAQVPLPPPLPRVFKINLHCFW